MMDRLYESCGSSDKKLFKLEGGKHFNTFSDWRVMDEVKRFIEEKSGGRELNLEMRQENEKTDL